MNAVIDHNSNRNKRVDEFEAALLHNLPAIKEGLKHFFVDGAYIRVMTVQAPKEGAWITSRIHRTEHAFKLLKGKITIWDDNGKKTVLVAPYEGITKVGTRRAAYIWPNEELIWATCHLTDIVPENDSQEAIEAAVELIGNQIIEPHENYVLGGEIKRNVVTKRIDKQDLITINY